MTVNIPRLLVKPTWPRQFHQYQQNEHDNHHSLQVVDHDIWGSKIQVIACICFCSKNIYC